MKRLTMYGLGLMLLCSQMSAMIEQYCAPVNEIRTGGLPSLSAIRRAKKAEQIEEWVMQKLKTFSLTFDTKEDSDDGLSFDTKKYLRDGGLPSFQKVQAWERLERYKRLSPKERLYLARMGEHPLRFPYEQYPQYDRCVTITFPDTDSAVQNSTMGVSIAGGQQYIRHYWEPGKPARLRLVAKQ